MSTILALALCLAPQAGRTVSPTAPAAPSAPQYSVRRVRTYDPALAGTANGLFHEMELWTPDGPERFGLYVPAAPSQATRPLLVHFHAANGGHLELLYFADTMLQEADVRGWFLVAPDQNVRNAAGQVTGLTYGNDEAQRRVQAVLDWCITSLAIDKSRIYGYGFSMGGGDCLAYAAQHLDPERGAFAAVVNHTGTLVLTEEWTRNASARPPLETTFSGTPASERYAYTRASSIEFPWSPTSPGVFTGAGRHAARNLAFTPMRSWFHTGDTNNVRAEEFMFALDTLVLDHDIEYAATVTGWNPHDWAYLDPGRACAWFLQFTLSTPSAGDLVFSRDARYHDLWLHRKTATDFGTLTFNVAPQANTIQFSGVSNVQSVQVDAALSQLATPGNSLTVRVERDTHPSFPGRPVVIRITNLPFVPTGVIQWNASPATPPNFNYVNGVLSVVSTAAGAIQYDLLEIHG
ncbi:MAG: hypothetical protein R3F49_01450 [Planctomycetota bacterium]